VKSEKLPEEEPEYNKWFNVDSFPSMNANNTSSNAALVSNSQNYTLQQQQQQAQINNALNVVSSSAVYTQPISIHQSSTTSTLASSQVPTMSIGSFPAQSYQGGYQPGFTFGFTTSSPQPVHMNGMSSNSSSLNLMQMPLMNQTLHSQMVPQQGFVNTPTMSSHTQQQAPQVPQMVMLSNFAFPQQALTMNPQFYNLMMTQFQQLKQNTPNSPPSSDESSDDRKRRQRSVQRRVRQTRPKVIEAKGAVQCKGRNRKKNSQCRNAALMEYIGPRPIYCAEHIELDPDSLYEKCKSPYQKEVGDKKGCKEVVLKEFGMCYKHYGDGIADMVRARDIEKARRHYLRVSELLIQLEREASAAKKKDGDLYQRKNKLIPKFQEMKKVIGRGVDEIQRAISGDLVSFPNLDLTAPVLNLSQDDLNANEENIDASLRSHANAALSPLSDTESSKMLDNLS
jgi:hypothetical protein